MRQPTVQAPSVLAWLLGNGRRIAEPNAFLEAFVGCEAGATGM